MLKKQSIRSGKTIKLNGKILGKEEVIRLSEEWTKKEEDFFKKLLTQSGRMRIKEGIIEVIK